MVERDTWESRENLRNAGDLLREFEEEYRRDNHEVRRQEKEEDDREYSRGGFPGWYTARRLYGWSDGEYDKQYWQRLERNWRWWKKEGLANTGKGRLTTVHEVVEEEGGKIEEWNEEDKMGNITDPMGEL